MLMNHIEHPPKNTLSFSKKFEATTFNTIRNLLTDKIILDACRSENYVFRNRLLTPVITILHMVVSGIWPENSFNASWQVLWTTFISYFPEIDMKSPDSSAVSKARNRIPCGVWDNIVEALSLKSQQKAQLFEKWPGHRAVLVDGTCLTTPDVLELEAKFGKPNSYHGVGRYPLVRVIVLCLANTMTVLNYKIGPYEEGEKSLLMKLLKTLNPGDILIGDRHFAGANLYWTYKEAGLEFVTRIHQKIKMSNIKRLWAYNENDFVGILKIGKKYLKENPDMPSSIRARFICVQSEIHKKPFWIVTSLLDNEAFPAGEIAQLNLNRWRIETVIKEFKHSASGDLLRSKSVEGVHNEIAAKFCALIIVRTIMIEAAINNNVDPIRTSYTYTVRALITFSPAMTLRPALYLPIIYKAMLKDITWHLVPYRPNRFEPRCITHEIQHYPRLRMTRARWRELNAA